MRVWRVAHKTATQNGFPSGPYNGKGVPVEQYELLWSMGSDHSDAYHPSPYADPELHHIAAHERCGFNSLNALNKWFDGWVEALDGAGFAVYEYDVPDWAARVGRFGQVVFSADEAVEVSSHDFRPVQMTLFA